MNALPKILIVDDQEIIRDTLESLLAAEDVELLFAENGEVGLRMAQEFQPDAILLDVMMPGMDGYETCRQIRADPALAEIPIIMMTALDDRNARLVGLLAGADDFLTKPFDGFEIQIRVKNIIRINRYRNLVMERTRFHWVVENDEKGYLVLDETGDIQYANQRAQNYLHLPEEYTKINFILQAKRYYQSHSVEDKESYHVGDIASYLVQPESVSAQAFWLRVELLNSSIGADNQRLVRMSDVTAEMSAYQDVHKIHLLVTHKLRTPVSLIYSSMSLLNAKMDLMSSEEVKPMVNIAWRGTERLVKSVHDILKYIDAPIALTEGSPLTLSQMHGMVNSACEVLELENVSFSMNDQLAKYDLGISTNAMELIIYEILGNSKKFHPSQTPHVHVRIQEHDKDCVHIQFLDDGQTMTADQINRAKLPYSQGEKWFTGEVSGMGLGIPLVATLLWQAGGQIRISNREEDAGICVNLILPMLK